MDDEPDIVSSVEVGLRRLSEQYDVLGLTSGMDCIKNLEQGKKPDIIILDIMMPGLNGWQVLDILKSNRDWRDIPVIFLTALDDRRTMEKGMATNSYCIKKPFSLHELKETIEKILEGDALF